MHKSTVSLALSGKGTISAETRRKVMSVARESGYEPNLMAQRLAHGQGSAMVCLFSGVLDVGLATEKILLIQKALTVLFLEAPIYTCYDSGSTTEQNGISQTAQMRQLCRQRPRAIICAAQRIHPAVFHELAEYQSRGGIVVSYDTPVPLPCDQVVFDRENNAYRAARYLLERGHRRIGLGMSQVGNVNNGASVTNDPQQHRIRGFRRALAEYGVPFRDEWFFRNTTYEKGGAEMAYQFFQLAERPTAIAIVNDYVALAFMVEVMRAGVRVPQDLSLIGHDNQPIASYCPVPLTSMTQPVEQIAQAVVNLLTYRINGAVLPDTPHTTCITGELVVRNSVSSFV